MDDDIWVMTEGTITGETRGEALRCAIMLVTGSLRAREAIDDDDVEEVLTVAERLHNWLRAEPGA